MHNPSGTTHDRSVTDKSLLKEQMAVLGDLKDLLEDTSKKNKKAFIVCHHSPDGRHDYHPITEPTIPAKTASGASVKVSHYFADGLMHYWEKCSHDKCSKIRMTSSNAAKGNV